ncbi:MAG: AAA family ATPase [Candidatus Omnitrophica bacterium]|nr:AAA family ATPase [Candidatus Omnitrophota bacterium]
MYLKELEIFGFKSFPQKTSLKFESGITVVVGPNGCGKSNVFDSIKWSLGEQSPKSLRGTKMEDIIFNGTEHHPPLNYAEVNLVFCNEDKYLPIDFREVSVGRRLYRSGESQYFINKNVVRLKDVQELFMGTGIGESTYSFVEQGKIEIFLSYKPEDKRLIFDEASGIVKYKERKRETMRRLKEAEDNMLRLDDILSELKRQIRYLERQVEKAKKYKEVQHELVEVEKKIASLQVKDLEEKINKVLDGLNDSKAKESDKDEQLKEVNQKWEELHTELKSLRGELDQASAAVASLQAQTESATSNIAVNKQRIEELTQRNKNLELAKINLNQRFDLQKERNRTEKERLAGIDGIITQTDQVIENYRQEKESLLDKVSLVKNKSKDYKETILESENKKAHLHNVLIEIQTTLLTLANRKKRLLLDKAKLETMLNENRQRLNESQQAYSEAGSRLEGLQNKKNNLIARKKQMLSLIDDTKNSIFDKEKELLELNASYEFLKDLKVKYENFSVKKKITVIFDEEPKDINKLVASIGDVTFVKEAGGYRAEIEAKVISFEEKQLQDRITAVRVEIDERNSRLGSFEQDKKRLSEDLSNEVIELEEEKRKFQDADQRKNTCQRELDRLEEEAELLTQETKTTFDEISDSERKQAAISQEADVAEEVLAAVNQELVEAQNTISQALERVNEIDVETARSHAQKQSLVKEKETLESNITLFQSEIGDIQSNLNQVDQEKSQSLERVNFFGNEIVGLELKITESTTAISQQRQVKDSLEKKELGLLLEVDKAKAGLQIFEKERQELRTATYNKKLEIQSLEYEKQKVADYIKQVYNIEFNSSEIELPQNSLEDLGFSKEKFQKRIKSLGEVNLVAIEEFEELKKREEFLETQKNDLITSKDNLKKAIQKINRTSKELFLDTFNKIQVEFKQHFKFLFNGGRANLTLVDPENVLESGVEIEVQPPGKKLQNVSLLSGGEKALTAISLIFAIFKVRPSPLCVLDEIDAPLDEANVDRFNHLLKKFSSFSQFILITHNKKSMSNADVLYGVTMQEKGISKLVSVKFAEDAEKAPASR